MRYGAGLVVNERFPMGISPADYALELDIDREWLTLATHPDTHEKTCAFLRMRRLIALRSQSRIEQMERERGLR